MLGAGAGTAPQAGQAHSLERPLEGGHLVPLPGSESEGERQARSIGHQVDLGAYVFSPATALMKASTDERQRSNEGPPGDCPLHTPLSGTCKYLLFARSSPHFIYDKERKSK